MYDILLQTVLLVYFNTSVIIEIHSVVSEIIFVVTNGLISQYYIVFFVHPIYVNGPHLRLSSTT